MNDKQAKTLADFYSLIHGGYSDTVESILWWTAINCGNKGVIEHNGKFQLIWYLNHDAEVLYDGLKDEKLPLYTTKEIMEKYYEIYKLDCEIQSQEYNGPRGKLGEPLDVIY